MLAIRRTAFQKTSQLQFIRKMSFINVFQAPTLKPESKLFKHQLTLPPLPVPSLKDTLSKYLITVRPLITEEEYQVTHRLVNEFMQPGGIGEQLQSRLLQRAEQEKQTSWLYHWWNKHAYFSYREPIVINVNYFFHFKDDLLRMNQVERATSLIQAVLAFRKKVIDQTLEPEMARNAPLCSIQYRAMFNTCRIPAKDEDHVVGYDPELFNHIAVVRHNKFYVFDAFQPNSKEPLTAGEIKTQLKRILELAGTEKELPLGVLTTEHRDTWTQLRSRLIQSHPSHLSLLQTLESAICLICLDDQSPVTLEEMARQCWHGDARNRWFDKSLQFIVCENGKAGFNGEHSLMDATPTGRLCEWMLKYIENQVPAPTPVSSPTSSSSSPLLPLPQRLHFQLTSMHSAITLAEQRVDRLIQHHEVKVLAYFGYGKEAIKRWKLSPDAFVQLALQLAYYKMYGQCKPTYETAQTRSFAYGRTETGRTVSMQSKAFVQSMMTPSSPTSVSSEASFKEKYKLLKLAAQYHQEYMLQASKGQGIDRHLSGLKWVLNPTEPLPSLFKDPVYQATCHWTLSTSQLSSEYFDGYGWGEVVPDGYGLAYMIQPHSIHVNIACQQLNASRFRFYLTEAFNEMKQVCEASTSTSSLQSKL